MNTILLNTEFCKLDHQWNYKNIYSPFVRIYYVTKGKGSVIHNHKEHILTPGIAHIIPPFTKFSTYCDNNLEKYYLLCLIDFELTQNIFQSNQIIYSVSPKEKFEEKFKRLLQLHPNKELKHYDPKFYDNKIDINIEKSSELPSALKLETEGLILQLLSCFVGDALPETQIQNEIGTVLSYIKNNLNHSIKIKDLADMLFLSEAHFSRKFLKIMGIRPGDYIIKKKIEKAQFLLLSTNNPQKMIAEKTGFSDVGYFNRIFTKITGLTPGSYRKSQLY